MNYKFVHVINVKGITDLYFYDRLYHVSSECIIYLLLCGDTKPVVLPANLKTNVIVRAVSEITEDLLDKIDMTYKPTYTTLYYGFSDRGVEIDKRLNPTIKTLYITSQSKCVKSMDVFEHLDDTEAVVVILDNTLQFEFPNTTKGQILCLPQCITGRYELCDIIKKEDVELRYCP